MLRTKLVAVFGVLLALILGTNAVLLWATSRTTFDYERSQVAQAQLEAHLHLALDIYRHVKQLSDLLIAAQDGPNPALEATRASVFRGLERLDALHAEEQRLVQTSPEAGEEAEEGPRIERIRTLLQAVFRDLDRVRRLWERERYAEAQGLITQVLRETIDGRLGPLIDEAIADESGEVSRAELNALTWSRRVSQGSVFVSVFALTFAAFAGFYLLRRLRRPIDRLLAGTEAVARGELSHRIAVEGGDELAELAVRFNAMAVTLEANEARLRASHHELERRVGERTAELEGAFAKLREMDRTRRKFLVEVSHELRTPLTAIRGEAELALRGERPPPEGYRDTIEHLHGLSEQIACLVDDLVVLARSESVEQVVEPEPISLSRVLSDACADGKALASSKQITVSCPSPADGVIIQADPYRLRQLLLTLLDNGVKYSPDAGEIAICCEHDRNEVRITVADRGIGIAQRDLGRIFERFFRGEKAKALAPVGSGLGLSVAQALARAQNGRLSISSVEGQGTRVTLHLPLAVASDAAD